jgi:Trehalose utilisation
MTVRNQNSGARLVRAIDHLAKLRLVTNMRWHFVSPAFTLSFFYCTLLVPAQKLPGTALVLIYSATQGYRHDSIPTAIQSLKNKSPSYNIIFNNTEDPGWFTDGILAQYDAVLFLSTTGEGDFFSVRTAILECVIYILSSIEC